MNLTDIRRDFHKYPEVGFTEFRTASKVIEMLEKLNIPYQYGQEVMDTNSRRGVPSNEVIEEAYKVAIQNGANEEIIKKMAGGYTAVVATVKGQLPGPCIAFRFDMDALPVVESQDESHFPNRENFQSLINGNMHACGHDGHTTIGLGLAEKLLTTQFAGTVKLIFQPAEEGVRGAYSIVQKNVVDDVDYMICFHLGTGVNTGQLYASTNEFLASSKLKVTFTGVPSHAGASPEEGRNALLGAATALLNIHSLPRFSTGSSRVNVGILEGGTAANIIPASATMIVETRASNEATNEEIERRVRKIIENSANMHELKYSIEVIGKAIPINCDQELAAEITKIAKDTQLFEEVQERLVGSSAGSEDASFLIKRVQEKGGKGTYMIIGSTIAAPHHHMKFDIDEASLVPAVELLTNIVQKISSKVGE